MRLAEFLQQFKKVNEDASIDPSDKVEKVLGQAIIHSSRSRSLVDSFPANRDKYSKEV